MYQLLLIWILVNFFYIDIKKVVRMENHLRATHKITDNVLYKKYLRAAIPESSVDPKADDGLSDVTTDEEEKRYQDFMKTCRKYHKEGIHIDTRGKLFAGDPEEDPYDESDPDWFTLDATKMLKYMAKQKEKQRKGMLYYAENFGKNLLLF